MAQMNLSIKQKQIHGHRVQTWLPKGRQGGGHPHSLDIQQHQDCWVETLAAPGKQCRLSALNGLHQQVWLDMQGPLGVTKLQLPGQPRGVPSHGWEKQKQWWLPLVALSAMAGDWGPEREQQGLAGKE